MDPEKPTAESIEAARSGLPADPKPPVQISEADYSTMTPEQIDAAFSRMQLHLLIGGTVDDQGWPVDGKGRRLMPPGP